MKLVQVEGDSSLYDIANEEFDLSGDAGYSFFFTAMSRVLQCYWEATVIATGA